MARPAFKSEKRKKELARLKKQEEKRQKRISKGPDHSSSEHEGVEGTAEDTQTAEPGATVEGA